MNQQALKGRSPWRWITRVGLLTGIPTILLLVAQHMGWAGTPLKTWTDGDVLTAAELNANFATLQAAITSDTPQQVVEKFNGAVDAGASVKLGAISASAPQFDLRWLVMHGAASAACAALSPVADSPSSHVVLPKPGGVTCTAACQANTGGKFTSCRTSVAVGSILPTQATSYTDVVGINYNYGCEDTQDAYDETKGQGLSGTYTAYCCCYQAR